MSITGAVRPRPEENRNPNIATGDIEIEVAELRLLSRPASNLPFELNTQANIREDLRLRYRFLDLRTERLQRNLRLRTEVIQHIRTAMTGLGFLEIQTPILTSSSPEGARDYLVPSRRYPGRFYALPQAPQQFKQLLMVGGFERYFQIAACFRDEDGRADRSPGEFYQLDLEMAFATQDDVFGVVEAVFHDLFGTFSEWTRTAPPYPRIPYAEALLRFGTDKPDLRNPLVIADVSDVFAKTDFKAFAGKTVRCIRIPGGAAQTRSFFDKMGEFAQDRGASGLAWLKFTDVTAPAGPIAKFLPAEAVAQLVTDTAIEAGDAVVFIADEAAVAAKLAGVVRTELGERLDLIEGHAYRFCWIVDYPMYERNEDTGAVEFSHNPFSMPQGGAEALDKDDPLSILAYQYDIVCNGYELSSGAVRNHDPDVMLKAFALAGYDRDAVEAKFPALFNAFHYGAPPHAGVAPGIDRIMMLLADEPLIRDVIAFPMAVTGLDLLMGAPSEVTPQQLRDLHIRVDKPK